MIFSLKFGLLWTKKDKLDLSFNNFCFVTACIWVTYSFVNKKRYFL